ncbi:unnamed protein product (macronuclear) [Paramecium tetraurelia]|uniref:RING-type domain-containing protein n=1 Tax=Paramecium tetraurelia TaxID=5888 RepID=A0DSS8_PARTE|nr:uncharacterized protein GSPATT00019788001 [Paramecium tetraurelia]CAK86095.1 unnamed protein product [Paramecium tetraurelia]|eukprot:XP_001453492.1 hypothetical protein (macronuclear) [Paramecium tetraurelia strain d4-2]
MSRHSKNNTANPVFTYAERKMVKDFGTQNSRVGSDSQRPFDFCYLCISRVIEPLTCEKGHLFCRECIIQNMVKQKQENEKLIAAYNQKKQQQEHKQQQQDEAQQKEKEQNFEKLDYQNDVIERRQFKSKVEEKLQGYINLEAEQKKKVLEKMQLKGKEMLTMSKKDLTCKNFWVPESQPEQQEEKLEQPKNICRCPANRDHEIKLKKLYPAKLNDNNGETKEVFCYACNKTLKYQKIGMSKHCGHVMCMSCISSICLPDKKCMVCNKDFEKKDIIQLQEAHSGFASHNQVEVKIFNPVMLI